MVVCAAKSQYQRPSPGMCPQQQDPLWPVTNSIRQEALSLFCPTELGANSSGLLQACIANSKAGCGLWWTR